jgi:hypothetical protein
MPAKRANCAATKAVSVEREPAIIASRPPARRRRSPGWRYDAATASAKRVAITVATRKAPNDGYQDPGEG